MTYKLIERETGEIISTFEDLAAARKAKDEAEYQIKHEYEEYIPDCYLLETAEPRSVSSVMNGNTYTINFDDIKIVYENYTEEVLNCIDESRNFMLTGFDRNELKKEFMEKVGAEMIISTINRRLETCGMIELSREEKEAVKKSFAETAAKFVEEI